jgi:hypothetical protein
MFSAARNRASKKFCQESKAPTLKQTGTIKKQRSSDPDEFWQFQASVARLAASTDGETPMPFPRHVKSHGPAFPVNARWLVYHARMTRGDAADCALA